MLGFFLRLVLSFRYRITTQGLDTLVLNRPTLFLPNHPALIDPFIVYALLAKYHPRPLIDEQQLQGIHGRLAAKILNAVGIPDIHKSGFRAADTIRLAIQEVLESLKHGDHVLLYPSGQIYRSAYEKIGGKSAAWTLVQEMPEAQVILVRTTGLWGSSFSYGDSGKEPHLIASFLKGMVTVLGNLIFFTPKRSVHVEFIEVSHLHQITDKRIFNRELEAFYNEKEQDHRSVRRWFWRSKI